MTSKFLLSGNNAWVVCALALVLHISPLAAQEPVGPDVDIDSDAESSTGPQQISVPLHGRGIALRSGYLTVDNSTLDLGTVEIGSAQSGTVTITHNGQVDTAVEILGGTLFGQDADEFFLLDANGNVALFAPRILLPGESILLSVRLDPVTPGEKNAGLRLSIANETTPFLLLFKGQARFPLTSDLSVANPNLELGQVAKNSNATAQIVLSNEGGPGPDYPSITVSAIEMSGTNANAFNPDFVSVVLEPGASVTVPVSLDTATAGFKAATASVFHDGNNGANNIPLQVELSATVVEPNAIPVNFSVSSLLADKQLVKPTTLQFGPDSKLYVGEMDGWIHIFDITRNGPADYSAELDQTIDLIHKVQNHNDDGTLNFGVKRLLTGIHVTGTAASPVIYAASSDPRQAAGPSGNDSNLDTNSGILHKLTKNGNTWSKQDLVRGLPRSEENHVPNGLVLVDNKIYLNIGGHTNEGVPSNNFAELPEYALSAATLEIDLAMIGNSTYDIPTLDGPADEFDPFGGHDGLNQAMLVEDGPIKIFTSGLRNAYDIVYTEAQRFYIWDNGPNTGWGGQPGADCLNTIDDGGSKSMDGLHLISRGYYAGHPNPTRGSKANTFGGQSPIEGPADPRECDYLAPGPGNGALTLNNPSTNGLDEYVASNFGGAMRNNLLAVAMNGSLYRVELNADGDEVTSKSILETLGSSPLDVTTQADDEVFPGTIWVADFFGNELFVLEPADY